MRVHNDLEILEVESQYHRDNQLREVLLEIKENLAGDGGDEAYEEWSNAKSLIDKALEILG